MKKGILLSIAILLLTSTVFGQTNKKVELSQLEGPYMGYKLPGVEPEKFPGKRYYRFFNNGKECYYIDNGIWYSRIENGKWIKPVYTNINYGEYADFEMNISPDGKRIFFNSADRPVPEGIKKNRVQTIISVRNGDKWTRPEIYDTGGMYVTSTLDGTLYYTNVDKYAEGFIAKSRFINSVYQKEETIPEPVFSLTESDSHPCIAPDESYLIFDSGRKNKLNNCPLFISYKKNNGSWTEPKNMGKYINHFGALAKVTSDGKLIFYHDNKGVVWWVSADIINSLKPNN